MFGAASACGESSVVARRTLRGGLGSAGWGACFSPEAVALLGDPDFDATLRQPDTQPGTTEAQSVSPTSTNAEIPMIHPSGTGPPFAVSWNSRMPVTAPSWKNHLNTVFEFPSAFALLMVL